MSAIIYVAGPMTGLPEYNYPAFQEAQRQLEALGFEVRNPIHIAATVTDKTWAGYMKATTRLLTECDAVALLPGWENSRGASIEEAWARGVGMEVRPLDRWLASGDPQGDTQSAKGSYV